MKRIIRNADGTFEFNWNEDMNTTIKEMAEQYDELYQVVTVSGNDEWSGGYTFNKELAEDIAESEWMHLFDNDKKNTRIEVRAYNLERDWCEDVESFGGYDVVKEFSL